MLSAGELTLQLIRCVLGTTLNSSFVAPGHDGSTAAMLATSGHVDDAVSGGKPPARQMIRCYVKHHFAKTIWVCKTLSRVRTRWHISLHEIYCHYYYREARSIWQRLVRIRTSDVSSIAPAEYQLSPDLDRIVLKRNRNRRISGACDITLQISLVFHHVYLQNSVASNMNIFRLPSWDGTGREAVRFLAVSDIYFPCSSIAAMPPTDLLGYPSRGSGWGIIRSCGTQKSPVFHHVYLKKTLYSACNIECSIIGNCLMVCFIE